MPKPGPSAVTAALPVALTALLLLAGTRPASARPAFNVKDFGATGRKTDDARPSLQRAIDACAAAGGGIVRLPPGQYTSGTLHLRSHVHLRLEEGATLFASQKPEAYDFGQVPSKAALIYGEDLQDVSLSGQGVLDGQAEYEWRADDYERAFDHKIVMQSLGKPLWRSFPKGFPPREVFPHLVWLGRSKDLRFSGLTFSNAPGWTLAFYGCQRLVFDDLRVYSSLREAVWADGIDLDGCREVSISDCAIATGDDCVVFISTDAWGPALPCENITVKRCRLSSASAGVKFSEGNRVAIRNVRVSQTVFTNVNRALVFSVTLGGQIADVRLSDLTIHCRRFDWFWAGDGQPFHFRVTRLSEFNRQPPQPDDPPPGVIRNVVIRNVTAHGQGSSLIHGHADSWLDGLRFENLKLFLSTDPGAPFDRAEHAFDFRRARNLKLKRIEVIWQQPALERWKSALYFEDIVGLELDSFSGRAAWPARGEPAVALNNVAQARVRRSRAPEGAGLFLQISGPRSRDISLQDP